MKVTITKVFSAALVLLLVGACSSTNNLKQQEARSALANKGISFNELGFISAAKYGKTDIVQQFLNAGMDVNANMDGTALIAATASKNLAMVKFLIAHGADVNECNYLGSPLNAATYVGNYDIAKYLIDNGAEVNLAAEDGTTPLVIAAQTGQGEMIELLADNGANVNYQMPVTEMTPLVYAASKGKMAAVEQLIKAGANVRYIDPSGISVLMWALLGNHLDIAKVLIENGANPKHDRVMVAALAHDDSDFIGYLIDKGVDVNGKAFGKMPYIVWCAKNNLPKSAEVLVKYGADINAKDSNGSTALDWALINKEYGLVKVLDPSINISALPKKTGDPNLRASKYQFDQTKAMVNTPTGTDGIDSMQQSQNVSPSEDVVVPGEGQQTNFNVDQKAASVIAEHADSKPLKSNSAVVVPNEAQKTQVNPGKKDVLTNSPYDNAQSSMNTNQTGKQDTFDPTSK